MYFYHGHASALGGTLVRPFQKTIEPQAAVSLPITGGSGVSRIDNYSFEGLISFKMAQSDVGGGVEKEKGDHVHSSRISVVIEGLNILNMVTADRIVARLACEHNTDVPGTPITETEPSIITTGCHFDGLKIAGHAVDVVTDHRIFCDFDTYGKCQQVWANGNLNKTTSPQNANARSGGTKSVATKNAGPKGTQNPKNAKAAQTADSAQDTAPNQPPKTDKDRLIASMIGSGMDENDMKPTTQSPQHLKDTYQGFVDQVASKNLRKTMICSFVTEIKGLNGPEIKACGPIVVIPQFGTVYLGELMITHGMRRVTMLRLELGSPDGGSLAVGSGTGNGTGYP